MNRPDLTHVTVKTGAGTLDTRYYEYPRRAPKESIGT